MKRPAPDVHGVSLAVLVAVMVAAGTSYALSQLAKPADFASRGSGLEQKIDRIERLPKAEAKTRFHPVGAACREASPSQMAAFRNALTARAAEVRLTPVSFSLLPAEDQGRLALVSFQLETIGSYEGTALFLSSLSGNLPEIFADRADLTSTSGAASLRFSGHFYCLTGA